MATDRTSTRGRPPGGFAAGRRGVFVASLCLAGATPGAVSGQAAGALTAEESVRLGLEHSVRLRAARADAAAARSTFRQVRAGLLPALRGQATYTRLVTDIPALEFALPGVDTTFTVLPVERSRYHSEASVEQVLFSERLRNETSAAAREAEAADWRLEREQADVALDIRSAYWNLYRAIAVDSVVVAALAQVEEHLQDVGNLLEEGAALTVDLLAAQTRRSEVLLERVEAQNAIRVGRLELNRLIGLPLDTPVQPLPVVEVAVPASDLDALTAEALDAHPELQALDRQVAATRARVAAARGGGLPELGFVSRYVYARPNPYFFVDQERFRGTLEVGLSVQWSLWEGGRTQAAVGEARARLDGAEARLADAREQVAVTVARQFLEVQRAAEALEVAEQHIVEAEETFRVVRQQFAEAATLAAQVLDAEQAYRGALASRARAVADHAVAHAALLNAVGRVW